MDDFDFILYREKGFPELTAKYGDFCNQIPDCFHSKFRNDKFSVSE